MIDRTHSLPVTRQCQLLALNRFTVYYQLKGVSDKDLKLMRQMDIMALYPKRTTSRSGKGHYPYLLKGLTIDRPNQVWATDLTYIPMAKGFVYIVASMDWYSRKVLSWRLSNGMDADFCVEALEEAIRRYGTPEIFNRARQPIYQ